MEAFVGARKGNKPITRVLVLSTFPFFEKLSASLNFWLEKAFLDPPAFEISHLNYRAIFPLKHPESSIPREASDPLSELVKAVDEKKIQAIFLEKLSLEELDRVHHALGLTAETPVIIDASLELYETILNPVKLRIFAQSAGLNLYPWSGMASRVDPETNLICGKEYDEAFVRDADSGLTFAAKYKFPLVLNSGVEGTEERIESASRLVVAFTRFKNADLNSVYLSKYEKDFCQVDLIIFSDQSGKVEHLLGFSWEAECGNSGSWGELPRCTNQIDVQKMGTSCKALVKSLRYSGVATVSFWCKPNDKAFYFKGFLPGVEQHYLALESWMGFSLPAMQLQIAMGIPLDNIDDFLTQSRSFSTLLTKESDDKYLWETSLRNVAPVQGYHFIVDAPLSLFLKTLGKSTDLPKSVDELSTLALEEGQAIFLQPASVLLTASGKSVDDRSLRMQKLLKRMLRWDDFGKMLKKLQTFDQSHATSPVGEIASPPSQGARSSTSVHHPTSFSTKEDDSDKELRAALLTLKEKLSGKFLDSKKASESFQSILQNQALFLSRIERVQNDISLLQSKEQVLDQISILINKEFTLQFESVANICKAHLKSHVYDSRERSTRLLKEVKDYSEKLLQSSNRSTGQSQDNFDRLESEVHSIKTEFVLLKEESSDKLNSFSSIFDQKFDLFQRKQEDFLEKQFSVLATRLNAIKCDPEPSFGGANEECPTTYIQLSTTDKKKSHLFENLDLESTPTQHNQINKVSNPPLDNVISLLTSSQTSLGLLTEDTKGPFLQLKFSPKDDINSFLWAFEYSLPQAISPRKKISALLQCISQEPLVLVYRKLLNNPDFSYQDLSKVLIEEYSQSKMQD